MGLSLETKICTCFKKATKSASVLNSFILGAADDFGAVGLGDGVPLC